jgi:hypothetical protein
MSYHILFTITSRDCQSCLGLNFNTMVVVMNHAMLADEVQTSLVHILMMSMHS